MAHDLFVSYAEADRAWVEGYLLDALERAGVRVNEIDALIICTCTGYLCPGLTSYVAEQLGLRPNAFLQDLVGLGCGAAIPMLRAASHVIAAQPDAVVACVAVEICSAAFYLDDDPGERTNLRHKYPQLADELLTLAQRWREEAAK